MTKPEIQKALLLSYATFVSCIRNMPETEAKRSADGKWSPARQLEHLVRSVQPVAVAFSLPKFLLTLLFGKANRPTRSYGELIEKYKSKLAGGGKASGRFIPGNPTDLASLSDKMERTIQKLIREIDQFSETDLDHFILPHPLLGKLTFREMLYFTAYHAEHHNTQIDLSTKYPSA